MLKDTFITLAGRYTTNHPLGLQLWAEIKQQYDAPQRWYHTLLHLEHLLQLLTAAKDKIVQWDTLLFTLFYHDIVYSPLKGDNEAKSAVLAQERLSLLNVPQPYIQSCVQQILATKKHEEVAQADTNYFTDADLGILGQDWRSYQSYYHNVRKEYQIYPDFMYKPGRKKVLQHFLAMPRIYKTDWFYNQFETQARLNLQQELTLLA